MTVLSVFPFSFFSWTYRKAEPMVHKTAPFDGAERRMIVADLITAGACDSEYGVQMLMSVFPDQF